MLAAFLVSLKVTLLALPAILIVGLGLALFLARARSRWRHLIEVVVILPVLLPPTVTGYYLLALFGRGTPWARAFGLELLFTPAGAAIAAAVMGLPLMVIASRAALAAVDRRYEAVARTLGAGEWAIFTGITLPLARKGILAGLLLGTARAFGEFGATLMVAGSIPGRTRTLSLALYDAVQAGDNVTAAGLVILLTAVTVIVVVGLRALERGGWAR